MMASLTLKQNSTIDYKNMLGGTVDVAVNLKVPKALLELWRVVLKDWHGGSLEYNLNHEVMQDFIQWLAPGNDDMLLSRYGSDGLEAMMEKYDISDALLRELHRSMHEHIHAYLKTVRTEEA